MANATAVFNYLVAEWIHFTRFGIILATIKRKVYTFWWVMNTATKIIVYGESFKVSNGFAWIGPCFSQIILVRCWCCKDLGFRVGFRAELF